jgi:serine/threonine-protein kinase HipA
MRKLDVRFARSSGDPLTVGTLAEDRGRIYFEYTPEFLNTDLNLSPFHLPFESGLFEHRDRQFGPLPGLFDDSLPDGWGLLLMDRHFRSSGRNLPEVSPLDRLAWLGTRTMGALTYHPSVDNAGSPSGEFDLHDLACQSAEILTGSAAEVLPELLRAGGSPGGARPKVLVGFNPDTDGVISGADDLPDSYEHWIVKFAGQDDTGDAGAIEYAYSLMARNAGIDMPPTRLFETPEGDRFFGCRRFDRVGGQRRHVHTFGNLIQSNFRVPTADYADLLKATSLLTRDHRQVLRTFGYMVFNVLAHNRDDHVKNFAFILDDDSGEWILSPAYDLLHTSGPGGEHTMTLAGEGRSPGRSHFLRLGLQVGVSKPEADRIIDRIQTTIARWGEFSARAGVSQVVTDQIAEALPELG